MVRHSAKWISFFIISFAFLAACTNQSEKQQPALNADSIKEHLITANKIMVDNESTRITDFINRHQWKMDSTRTGLHYWIYSKGKGAVPKANDKVKINYKLFLLDGKLVAASEKDKPLEITL